MNWRKKIEKEDIWAGRMCYILLENDKKAMKGTGSMREYDNKILTKESLTEVRQLYGDCDFSDGEVHELIDALTCFGYKMMHKLPLGKQSYFYM